MPHSPHVAAVTISGCAVLYPETTCRSASTMMPCSRSEEIDRPDANSITELLASAEPPPRSSQRAAQSWFVSAMDDACKLKLSVLCRVGVLEVN